jgi:hypothetical protein
MNAVSETQIQVDELEVQNVTLAPLEPERLCQPEPERLWQPEPEPVSLRADSEAVQPDSEPESRSACGWIELVLLV